MGKATGYQLQELLGRSLFNIMHPAQLVEAKMAFESMLENPGVPMPRINRFIHKNGSYVWVGGMAINLLHDENVKAVVSNYRDITQQREAEQLIKQSESNLKAIFDNTTEGFILTDSLCIVKLFNAKAKEHVLLNMHGDISVGRDIFDFVEDERRPFFETAIANVLTGETVQYDRMYVQDGGHKVWYDYSITPVLNDEIIDGICITSRDITERKAAEEELARNEIRFRTLMQNNSDGLTLVEAGGRVIETSPSGRRLLGYDNGEQPAFFPDDKIHPDDLKYVRECFGKVVAEPGSVCEIEFRHIMPDGSYKWLDSTFQNLLREPAVQAVVLNYRDTSGRKEAEQKVLDNEKRYRALVENGGDAIVILSTERRPVYVSPSILRVIGYTEEEAMYLDMFNMVHPDDMDGVELTMQQAQANPGVPVAASTTRLKHKSGEWRWYEATATNMLHDEAINGLVYNFRDVTSRMLAEQQIEQQNIDLRKANAELDRFVYSTSHDLRSPLTSVLGLVGFIEEETSESDTREHAAMIRERITRLDDFIRNILDYSRNNRTEVNPEELDLNALAQAGIDSLKDMAVARGISFETAITQNHTFISDRQRLQIVLDNLVSNAIKYHRSEGEGRFVRIEGRTTANGLELKVCDNGIGITPAHLPRIFDMFYRVTGDMPGTGIGLYLVREILDKINGKVEVMSEINKGTSFILSIENLGNERETAGSEI
jgi:PAS domain S-box-containing protein